jgi:hydrogenase expression/formation protein HypE
MLLDENKIPIDEAVYSACEFLGLDPLYVACEGRFMLIVDSRVSNQVLAVLQKFDICSDAAIVGEVRAKEPGKVLLKSGIGGHRILDKLSGEQLPRIC